MPRSRSRRMSQPTSAQDRCRRRSCSSSHLYRTSLLKEFYTGSILHWVIQEAQRYGSSTRRFRFQISLYVLFCECEQAHWPSDIVSDLWLGELRVQNPAMTLSCGCVPTTYMCSPLPFPASFHASFRTLGIWWFLAENEYGYEEERVFWWITRKCILYHSFSIHGLIITILYEMNILQEEHWKIFCFLLYFFL